MGKFIPGLFAGGILGMLVAILGFIPVLRSQQKTKFDLGRRQGQLAGLSEAAEVIDKEFGRYAGQGEYRCLFSIKTTDVIVIETNGVKTVRIIP